MNKLVLMWIKRVLHPTRNSKIAYKIYERHVVTNSIKSLNIKQSLVREYLQPCVCIMNE